MHFLVINHSFLISGSKEDSFPKQKSKDTPPDVIRYSSTTADDSNEMGGFDPPAKFGSWGQLLSSSSKRQYSSLQPSNLPPSNSAGTSTLPRVARRPRQQQLYRGGRHPAGLSSESSAASESSESSDEEDEEEDEDEEGNENHSDATTYTGSEMALAANRNDQQKDRSKHCKFK